MPCMNNAVFQGRFGLFAGWILFLGASAEAASYNVTVNGAHFSPSALTIELGDTVVWENQDSLGDSHSTTSDLPFGNANYWHGILFDPGDTFSFTFSVVGTFTYHDLLDSGTGSITVILPAPAEIVLASPRITGNQFIFDATGLTVGKTNVLQASTNLTFWTSISTNLADTSSMTFTNATTSPQRFFRLLELP